jgi:hypothetical protein
MPTPTRAVEAYVAMWNAADDRERRALAEEALTKDAVLMYPTFEAQSRDDAVALAGRFHNDTPGARIEMLSGVEHHHGWCAWPGPWCFQTGRGRPTVNPLASSLKMDGCAA